MHGLDESQNLDLCMKQTAEDMEGTKHTGCRGKTESRAQ